jgi:hypothetical protein
MRPPTREMLMRGLPKMRTVCVERKTLICFNGKATSLDRTCESDCDVCRLGRRRADAPIPLARQWPLTSYTQSVYSFSPVVELGMLHKTKLVWTACETGCAPPQCGQREPLHRGRRRGCAARLMPMEPNIHLWRTR